MNAFYLSTSGDTVTTLPLPLEMEGYGCGVIEISGKTIANYSKQLYLCSDICEESVVGGIKLPVLRAINRNIKNGAIIKGIEHVIWLRVMRPSISSIRMYIADEEGKIVSLRNNLLRCTLLLIPNKNHE